MNYNYFYVATKQRFRTRFGRKIAFCALLLEHIFAVKSSTFYLLPVKKEIMLSLFRVCFALLLWELNRCVAEHRISSDNASFSSFDKNRPPNLPLPAYKLPHTLKTRIATHMGQGDTPPPTTLKFASRLKRTGIHKKTATLKPLSSFQDPPSLILILNLSHF